MERPPGKEKVRCNPSHRAFLAALLYRLPRDALLRLRLLARPERCSIGTETWSPAASPPSPYRSTRVDPAPCSIRDLVEQLGRLLRRGGQTSQCRCPAASGAVPVRSPAWCNGHLDGTSLKVNCEDLHLDECAGETVIGELRGLCSCFAKG